MRWFPALVAVVALVVLPASSIFGQEPAVEIRHKLTKGEALFYQTAAIVQAKSSSNRLAIRVLDVAADGTALLEVVAEDMRGSEGALSDEPGAPSVFRLRPDGTIAEQVSGLEVSELLLPLPAGPVRVGESWNRAQTASQGEARVTITRTATLVGVDAAGDTRTAKIRIRTEGRGTHRSTHSSGATIDIRLTIRENEDLTWSLTQGRVLQSAKESTITTEAYVTAGDRTIPASSVVTGTLERRLLDAASISVPAVPADVLIVPGKGVGSAALGQPAEALSGQFGAVSFEEQPGLKAKAGRWSNDLCGLFDPADAANVLGLLVGDRRYRTEKGIGFGSSEGAVLFAYGAEPVRVGFSMPKAGNVRALVYDSQGIAFVVIGQRAKDAPKTVPPTGTVYATIVFPPGGAAKIFAVP